MNTKILNETTKSNAKTNNPNASTSAEQQKSKIMLL